MNERRDVARGDLLDVFKLETVVICGFHFFNRSVNLVSAFLSSYQIDFFDFGNPVNGSVFKIGDKEIRTERIKF